MNYHGPIRTEHTILTRCAVGHIPSILRIGEITTPIANHHCQHYHTKRVHPLFSIVFSSLKYRQSPVRFGQKLPICCSLPIRFWRSSSLLLPLTPKTRIPIAYMIPPEKSSRNITLLPSHIKAPLPARSPQKLYMQSLSPSYPQHICRIIPVPFLHQKSASHGKLHGDTLLYHNPLRWHYPNQVRSKIYLPLSLSHKLPLALFSVFQYSTHLSRCQTSLPGRKNPGIYHNKSYFEISSIRRQLLSCKRCTVDRFHIIKDLLWLGSSDQNTGNFLMLEAASQSAISASFSPRWAARSFSRRI